MNEKEKNDKLFAELKRRAESKEPIIVSLDLTIARLEDPSIPDAIASFLASLSQLYRLYGGPEVDWEFSNGLLRGVPRNG